MAEPKPPAPPPPAGPPGQAQHSIGVATDAFSLPFGGGLLVFRAGQRVVAHLALRRAIEAHRLPVRFEE
jgi:hypothetical protein